MTEFVKLNFALLTVNDLLQKTRAAANNKSTDAAITEKEVMLIYSVLHQYKLLVEFLIEVRKSASDVSLDDHLNSGDVWRSFLKGTSELTTIVQTYAVENSTPEIPEPWGAILRIFGTLGSILVNDQQSYSDFLNMLSQISQDYIPIETANNADDLDT